MCNFILTVPFCFFRRATKKAQNLYKVKLSCIKAVNRNVIYIGICKYKVQAEDFAEFLHGNLIFLEDIH